MKRILTLVLVASMPGGLLACDASSSAAAAATRLAQHSEIALEPCAGDDALCGTYEVFEDRAAVTGRRIGLRIRVLPAREPSSRPPVFYLMGGPGGSAVDAWRGMSRSWMRDRHDIVLVDQRGTGGSNPLGCGAASVSRRGLQGYVEYSFGSPEYFAVCREELEQRADLALYTTPLGMDDLNDVREALGYDQVILAGGSYGTRAALVYMRRHPETVYAAILNGVAPMSFTNPLYHAREAQNALEATIAECSRDIGCREAFPDLERAFAEVMQRLDDGPATAAVRHPRTGSRETIRISKEAFADGLRVFMYYMPRARRVPLLIHRAWEGDFDAVGQEILESNFGLSAALQIGMLLSVTCAEDVARIDPESIPEATAGTFLGDARVRRQIAACEVWPLAELPPGYGDPVTVDVPVLLLSGSLDPVTGPRWGEVAARHLPGSLHVVAPGAHGVTNRCTVDISRRFLESGTVEGLDTSCVDDIRLPPFELY